MRQPRPADTEVRCLTPRTVRQYICVALGLKVWGHWRLLAKVISSPVIAVPSHPPAGPRSRLLSVPSSAPASHQGNLEEEVRYAASACPPTTSCHTRTQTHTLTMACIALDGGLHLHCTCESPGCPAGTRTSTVTASVVPVHSQPRHRGPRICTPNPAQPHPYPHPLPSRFHAPPMPPAPAGLRPSHLLAFPPGIRGACTLREATCPPYEVAPRPAPLPRPSCPGPNSTHT